MTSGAHPAASAVPSATWIKVQSVSAKEQVSALQTSTNLDLGECAAIILAEELGAICCKLYSQRYRTLNSLQQGAIALLSNADQQPYTLSVLRAS